MTPAATTAGSGAPRGEDAAGVSRGEEVMSVAPAGVGFLLGVAHRARKRVWEATIADLGLTAPQAAVLRLVADYPGTGVRSLARRLGTDPMNVQRIAEALVRAGLCETRRDPRDGRRRPLHPTPKGRRLAGQVAERARRSEEDLAQTLGPEDYARLVEVLRKVVSRDASGQGSSQQRLRQERMPLAAGPAMRPGQAAEGLSGCPTALPGSPARRKP